jgi:hypothetical protein
MRPLQLSPSERLRVCLEPKLFTWFFRFNFFLPRGSGYFWSQTFSRDSSPPTTSFREAQAVLETSVFTWCFHSIYLLPKGSGCFYSQTFSRDSSTPTTSFREDQAVLVPNVFTWCFHSNYLLPRGSGCFQSQNFSRTILHTPNRTLHTYPPMKMEHTQRSETLAFKLQTPGNHPE